MNLKDITKTLQIDVKTATFSEVKKQRAKLIIENHLDNKPHLDTEAIKRACKEMVKITDAFDEYTKIMGLLSTINFDTSDEIAITALRNYSIPFYTYDIFFKLVYNPLDLELLAGDQYLLYTWGLYYPTAPDVLFEVRSRRDYTCDGSCTGLTYYCDGLDHSHYCYKHIAPILTSNPIIPFNFDFLLKLPIEPVCYHEKDRGFYLSDDKKHKYNTYFYIVPSNNITPGTFTLKHLQLSQAPKPMFEIIEAAPVANPIRNRYDKELRYLYNGNCPIADLSSEALGSVN